MAAVRVKIYFAIIILFQLDLIPTQKIHNLNIVQILNNASGFITIGQYAEKVTLQNNEGKLLRRLLQNMNSIGFIIEPENVWTEMKKIQSDTDMATFGSQHFEIKIIPNIGNDGKYVKPSRKITEIEGQRLDDALIHLKNVGLNVIVGNIN